MEKERKENHGTKSFHETIEPEDRFDEVMADMNHAAHKAGLDQ